MHGMFFNFPPTFSAKRSAGLTPIGSHLRYVPDFCAWNGKLVLATDETSIQGNKLAGQPQSNLWFGSYDDLQGWGPASGYGGPWVEDQVVANKPSDPFLIAGFDRRVVHLAVGRKKPLVAEVLRASDQQKIRSMPALLARLCRVTIQRGDWHQPAAGYEFAVDRPVTVYLAVDRRGQPALPPPWKRTELSLSWGKHFQDDVYRRDFEAGIVSIPGNATEHTPGSFGMPHLAFVESRRGDPVQVTAIGKATVTQPTGSSRDNGDRDPGPVEFTLQVDRHGNGAWTDVGSVTVPTDGYVPYYLPEKLDAVWLRLKVNRDCVATAFLHQTSATYIDGSSVENKSLFSGLADVDGQEALGALVYAAKRNRNLRVITSDGRHFDFTKATFRFREGRPDARLKSLLHVEPEFKVDNASVVLESQGKTYRLPKGNAAFDKPLMSGWPRTAREVESERHLANIHGTFYEVPLVTNGAPPAWNRMRPVSSHSKQITDFCSWNGLLVLAGVRADATDDGHVFANKKDKVSLWFGGIDDLWKLGKPVGEGGPWRNSKVEKDVPSAPYLMTGYDKKSVTISHRGDKTNYCDPAS